MASKPGSETDDDDQYPVKDGYRLSPEGLAAVVSQSQLGAIDAFGGVEGLASAIGCDLKAGVPADDDTGFLGAQRTKFGSNKQAALPAPSLLHLYMEGLQDPTIIMLLCSAVISLILGLGIEQDWEHGWIEGTSISVTVILVISVAALTDYGKAKAFRDQIMKLENEKHVNVIRGGESQTIHPSELVVGDIVRLAVGDITPVDGVLIEGTDLKFDESALTGESNLIEKNVYNTATATAAGTTKEIDPFVISGTNAMQGTGKLLVLAVGSNCIQGKILARISERDESGDHCNDGGKDGGNEDSSDKRGFFSFGGCPEGADLMGKLDVLAVDIGKVGLIVAVIVFFIMFGTWIHTEFFSRGTCKDFDSESECTLVSACEWLEDATNSNSSSSSSKLFSKIFKKTSKLVGGGTCLPRVWTVEHLHVVLEFFITAVTILVVAVPEGLPLAVTLALAISISRMMRDNNQVKHMDSCETMGSATTICSDKTGTLTENKMTAMRAHVAGGTYEYVVGKSGANKNLGELIKEQSDGNEALSSLIAESILVNCSATSKVMVTPDNAVKYEGNATECALIKLSIQLGHDAETVRKSFKDKDSLLDWGVYAIPFSSEKKRMSWIIEKKNAAKKFRMYSKGAPKQLLDVCTNFVKKVDKSGAFSVGPFDAAAREVFDKKVDDYQKAGLRSLAIAYRDFSAEPEGGWDKDTKLETGLTLLAVVGIEDPLRPSVPGAIADCYKAGIDVRMCTGDALTTAVAIAKGCGILRPSDLDKDGQPKKDFAMTGAEFDDRVHRKDPSKPKAIRRVFDPTVNDAVDRLAEQFLLDDNGNKVLNQIVFDEIWPTLRVLARCQPEDKLTLVRGMRNSRVFMDKDRCTQLMDEHGIHIFPDFQVVAVTGDGTNDAPALKSANVGFAMGIVGTDTAKQACDIILIDDNFSSIVKAVMWGRNIFDSISKFLQFQLTVNIVAITLAVIGAFCYAESPLTAVQMLWVNMIMDSLASLALATELPTKELLDRMPYGARRPVISGIMATNIVGQATYQIAILCWVLFAPQTIPYLDPPIEFEPEQGSHHWSLFFNVFVLLQLFNEFNSRRLPTAEKLRKTLSEWNVFSGVFSNTVFVAVMVSTFALQVVIVQFGGAAVNLVPGGLTRSQWLFSIYVGVFGLVWQIVLNLFITIVFRKSGEEETKKITDSVERDSDQKGENAKSLLQVEKKDLLKSRKNWGRLKRGVKTGVIASKALNSSFRTGYKLESIVAQQLTSERLANQERSINIAKEILGKVKTD